MLACKVYKNKVQGCW